MIERRAYALAAAYVVGSVLLGLTGLMVGLLVMRKLPL
jgi:fluoride ion exporter CrcB/FEX